MVNDKMEEINELVQKQELRLKKQEIKIRQLVHSLHQVESELLQEKSISRYEALEKKISKQWTAIEELNEEIMVHQQDSTDDYLTRDIILETEEKYEDQMEQLAQKISSLKTASSRQNVQLPKIQIPIFDGNYDQWSNFHDIFHKVILENTSLSKVEKMQYLKTHIRGEPSRLVQHLQITEANFETAWEILQKRFHNKRLILSKLIDRILDLPNLHYESAEKIKELHDVTVECLEAIKNLGVDSSSWGPLVSRIIIRKWDPETNKLYEQSLKNSHEIPNFGDLLEFLTRRFQSLASISVKKNTNNIETNRFSKQQTSKEVCSICKGSHALYMCLKFKSLPVAERAKTARDKNLCLNCLNHDRSRKCTSNYTCRTCNKSHHTLLHDDNWKKSTKPTHRGQDRSASSSVSNNLGKQINSVFLATAVVQAYTASGSGHPLRVLIDSGSQVSLITEQAAQVLGGPREKIRAEVSGLGDTSPKVANWKIDVQLTPRFPSKFNLKVSLIVMGKLTQNTPDNHFNANLDDWHNRILADPTFNVPGPVDIILGAQEYGTILRDGLCKTSDGIVAQNTELGWILSGSIDTSRHLQVNTFVARAEEDQQLTKFWEMEEVESSRQLSQEDEDCEEFYSKTTQRNQDGSYTVRIPFKSTINQMGNSRSRAMSRFLQLEKRLAKNTDLKQNYQNFIDEYISLGHMVPVNDQKGTYYIPHQPVIRESSSTTKLRVVFDASCKTSTGISLNNLLHTGPRLQQDITDILLRWRKHRIVFTADIEKMYRQIKIHEEDRKFHRILWRTDDHNPIQEYELTTVTYGTTPAPYLAIRTLQQLARDEEANYPQVTKIVLDDFYVDDFFSGADSVEEALTIQAEVMEMLESGGFLLRKWSSNDKQLLYHLPENLRDSSILEISTDETRKSLGVHWGPAQDTFRFHMSPTHYEKLTKRNILSEVAKLFDPLGWLAPIVIKAKLLIQELWVQNLQWDHAVPEEIKKRWLTFQDQLHSLDDLKVPRWFHYSPKVKDFQLHGFCDASEKAFGAVIYSRITTEEGIVKITMLTAKSKVAPSKTKTTLPRLELCAAVLLAKLMSRTVIALDVNNPEIFAWSDSLIAISWIKGDINRWKTFVANRVSTIIKAIPAESWYHVRTEDNPADSISRGMDPIKLKDFKLWWNGPSWLQTTTIPSQPVEIIEPPEEKAKCFHTMVQVKENCFSSRFSNYTRMLRVTAYCNRFINGCKKKPTNKGNLTVAEMEEALIQIITQNQSMEFMLELQDLKHNKPVSKKSKISTLNAFLDSSNIIRVGGRLENSQLAYDEKHPIILQNNHLSRLIIENAHQVTLHGGNQATLAYVREKFWIINAKKTVRSVIRRCPKCIRYRAQAAQQQMGDLPAARVTQSPPFTHTGIDYAGPFQVRATKGRGHKSYKGYISIFVCFATKAIHLEVVSDMTTDSFLAAFKRFTARRGNCSHIYSDNGTTFVGANNIMEQEIQDILQKSEIQDKLVSNGTQWHFIPPAAPHFGGLWEAGVKSMKYHLKRVVGEATLTYEELSTLVYQIESCLNSRPLTPLSNDVNELQALTPGHFLIGRALMSPSYSNTYSTSTSLSERWKLIQKMKKDFWNSWSTEYLSRLQQRSKWKNIQNNIKVGELVLIKEPIDPSKWPLARILEVHPGKDDAVRVVTMLKAGGTTIKRSIHNIIPIPVDQDQEEEQDTSTAPPTNHDSNNPRNHAARLRSPFLVLMTILMSILTISSAANFTIRHPPPGLYIEHIGDTRIERGTFRIGLQYDRTKLNEDTAAVNQVVNQMEQICKQIANLSDGTPCSYLHQHLQQLAKDMSKIKSSLDHITKRQKRGVLGKLLTSIFGVNDEVYQDIEALDKNQHELITASKQQTKFMLSTVSKLNDTEKRMNDQLQRFNKKMKEGINIINDMHKWFNILDHNKLSIHVLAAYQIANNFIKDVIHHYGKLVKVNTHNGNFFDLLPHDHLINIVTEATKKLPSNLQILSVPLLSTKMEITEKYIQVFGYLPIAETSDFTLMKVTPVPLKILNGSYWTLEVPNEIIAVDYNSQLYFQISDSDLRNCWQREDHNYLCNPTSVQNIENSPNCIVDEIYQRTDDTSCKIVKYKITSIIWKQLYMPNTWMFITNNPNRIALTCNGIREDITINNTGILQVSQDCIIKTRQNILAPKRTDRIQILAGYGKHVAVNINTTIESHAIKPLEVEDEPVIGISNQFDEIKSGEEHLQEHLSEKAWKEIKTHNLLSHSITIGICIAIILLVIGAQYLWKARHRHVQPRKPATDHEMVELRPGRSRHPPSASRKDEEPARLEPLTRGQRIHQYADPRRMERQPSSPLNADQPLVPKPRRLPSLS